MRLLVLLHAGLGDVLMAIPALRALDAGSNGSRSIDVLVKSQLEVETLRQFTWKHIDAVVELRSVRKRGWRAIGQMLRHLRERQYDSVLAIHGTPALSTAVFCALTGARRRVGPRGWGSPLFHDTVKRQAGEHKSDYYLHFVTLSGLNVVSMKPSGLLEQPTEADAKTYDWGAWGTFVILAPGSGEYEAHKRWPATSYTALACRLLSEDPIVNTVVVVGAGSEASLVESIATEVSRAHVGRCHAAIGLPLPTVFSLYRAAACAVAGCSGSTHIAAAVGTPIVGIYGPTNPGFTGPNTDKLRVVRLGLACSPCYRSSFRQGCGTPICMTRISVEEVFAAVRATLMGAPYPPRGWFATTNATAPEFTAR